MSAGRNKNAKTRVRKGKQNNAAAAKRVRHQGIIQLRKAKRTKQRMYRLKNKLPILTGKAKIEAEKKLRKLKTKAFEHGKKSKHIRAIAALMK